MQTLLLVDDQPEKLRILESVAGGKNRRIFKASDLANAIQVIEGEPLDLIVTDLALHTRGSDRDGFDVLRAAKAKDPEVPVILVSEYLTSRDADDALDAGAFDVIDRASSRLEPDGFLRLKIGQALRLREALQNSR
jgi:CheY-like chemotaxis protein